MAQARTDLTREKNRKSAEKYRKRKREEKEAGYNALLQLKRVIQKNQTCLESLEKCASEEKTQELLTELKKNNDESYKLANKISTSLNPPQHPRKSSQTKARPKKKAKTEPAEETVLPSENQNHCQPTATAPTSIYSLTPTLFPFKDANRGAQTFQEFLHTKEEEQEILRFLA